MVSLSLHSALSGVPASALEGALVGSLALNHSPR